MMSEGASLLLVGEGNFSFSASLSESVHALGITATCLQNEQTALLQENASLNIKRLRDRGCPVLFEVDCTRLAEHEVIRRRLYDRVVFNFPHCGRKSGVKKNRALLAKFFVSAVEVLKADGDVHVALCNGQGGTPRDNPAREWHNSWQVVAMAAEAGLILSEIRPFEHDRHQGYRCTGYRSQDKGFHVDAALNHIFTRSLPYTPPVKQKMEAAVGKETVCYELPEELSEYVNRDFLGRHSHHPVKLVLEQLLREIKSSWPVCTVASTFPELVRFTQQGCLNLSSTEIYRIKPLETHPTISEGGRGGPKDRQPIEAETSPVGGYMLRPSLLTHTEEILQREDFSPGTFHALSGLVFRKVPISPSRFPAFHQLLLIAVLPSGSQPAQQVQNCLEASLSRYDVSFKSQQVGVEHQVLMSSRELPDFGQITSKPISGSTQLREGSLLTLVLNLDHLATLAFSIPDRRLLWSADPRFLVCFQPGTWLPGPFRAFSLYPPSYTHDVSFWTEPDGYEELDFHQVVRMATCGAVSDVQLVDRFRHPHMGHASLCYRLVYHSPDRALSRSGVLDLQNRLRSILPQRLNVTLR